MTGNRGDVHEIEREMGRDLLHCVRGACNKGYHWHSQGHF